MGDGLLFLRAKMGGQRNNGVGEEKGGLYLYSEGGKKRVTQGKNSYSPSIVGKMEIKKKNFHQEPDSTPRTRLRSLQRRKKQDRQYRG